MPYAATLIRAGDVGVFNAGAPTANYHAWADWLSRWSVPRPLAIHLSIARTGARTFIRIFTSVPDSVLPEATRRDIELKLEVLVPTEEPDVDSDRWLRALLRWLVCHELDEWISVDGVRVFDPHANGQTPTPENS